MAKKMKLMPLFQELKGRADISDRRPVPKDPGIYLMQLREQNGATALPRRRFAISINPGVAGSLPHPVKINYIDAQADTHPQSSRRERPTSAPTPQGRPRVA